MKRYSLHVYIEGIVYSTKFTIEATTSFFVFLEEFGIGGIRIVSLGFHIQRSLKASKECIKSKTAEGYFRHSLCTVCV